MPFMHSCVLLLVASIDLYIFIVGGVGCLYVCRQLGEVVLWVCVLACGYGCLFNLFVCFSLYWIFYAFGVSCGSLYS